MRSRSNRNGSDRRPHGLLPANTAAEVMPPSCAARTAPHQRSCNPKWPERSDSRTQTHLGSIIRRIRAPEARHRPWFVRLVSATLAGRGSIGDQTGETRRLPLPDRPFPPLREQFDRLRRLTQAVVRRTVLSRLCCKIHSCGRPLRQRVATSPCNTLRPVFCNTLRSVFRLSRRSQRRSRARSSCVGS